ncbi:SCO family protein [Hymenobacter taeanensis]|uniref:SCO family protein n=1 Tax=Hymenobacter taeanensis TaxID=2735321 RepID=A0A6M6BN15_9BACT|nr:MULTISPECIES: SCO family protein [Hymenobacter]QJX48873.1 SCO family protein [Hymenobacter taeanensis]UOQ81615.1 SCO family protein [Hymenobacter sp. 5414T-23]
MKISFLRSVGHLLLALTVVSAGLTLPSCTQKPTQEAHLPYLGEPELVVNPAGAAPDTIPYTVPAFTLTNQDSQTITNQTFAGKVYVTDFFFATCPSICPKMQSELLRVYEQFKGNPNVLFLSHTIDPAHDSIPVLRDYAERLGIKDASRWHFATAPHDTIFALARAYMTAAQVDKGVVGGYAHSGTFALIDSHRRIRGLYDGMEKTEVDRLIRELPELLREEANAQATAAK